MDTPGNSPGSMTYCCEQDGRTAGFQRRCHARRRPDAHLVRYRVGLRFRARASGRLRKSVAGLTELQPALLLPSHGPLVREPSATAG